VVAGLMAAVFMLLAAVAGVASVGYVQTKLALNREAAQRAEADRQRQEADGQRIAADRQRQEANRQRALAEAAEARAKGEAGRARTAEQAMRRQWYAASSNLMQPAWDTGQVGRLRALLAETEAYPDRGFEWYYWQRLCHLEQHTLIGHRHEVTSMSWSPDGTRLATGSWDGTAKVWEAASGRELLTLSGFAGQVNSVSWSPDGTRLATGNQDGMARVWDATGGRALLALMGDADPVLSVSWSRDGTRLATGGEDNTARVWDAASGRELLTLTGHTSWVTSVSWSPDGTRLATGSMDGTAKVWDAAGGRELLTLKGHTSYVYSVSWSPDGTRLATGGEDNTARVWDAAGGRELLTLKGHTKRVNSVSWSPDGNRLATGSFDGTAKVWEAAGGRVLFTLKGHTGEVGSVSWSPIDQPLAMSVSWSPDGTRLATGSGDGTAKVWDAAGGRELLTLKGHSNGVNSVAWSPDGTRLATGSSDGTAKVSDAAGGRELLTLQGHTGQVRSVAWSPDGQRLATGSWDGTAKVWDAAGAEAVQQWARQDRAAQDHTEPGHPEEAAAVFAKLVERTPESQAAVLMRLAEQSRKAGRLEQARQWWEKVLPIRARAVAQRPDDRQAWRNLGTVHAELGQPEAAAAFTKLVELTPESHRAVTLMGLAELDQKAGRPERAREWWAQAISVLTRAVAQRPDDRRAWRDLGIVHTELGQLEAAAAANARLLDLTPESHRAVTLMELAALDQKAGRPDRARQWWAQAVPLLTRAVAQRPDDRQAWRDLGIVRAELGQPEESATAFTKLMELTPESRDESLWWAPDPAGIGEALAAHDEIFGRVVRARPRDRNLLIARFHYCGRRRRWREAAEMAARIIELDPEDGQAREYRRALLLFTGDVESYRRATREDLAALKERNRNALGWLEMLGQFEFPRADATGPPPQDEWGSLGCGVNDYREGRYAGAIRHLAEATTSQNPEALILATSSWLWRITGWDKWPRAVASSTLREPGSVPSGHRIPPATRPGGN